MIIPIPSPSYPCALTETTREQAAALAETQDVYLYESTIIDAVYIVQPSVIITPVYPVMAMKRALFCDKCQEVKEHKLEVIRGWTYYVCDCGNEIVYYAVTKSGKL
ncbi:MAG TPA: hypothetical protein VIY48_07730 [Candidatus Paceibacterota bacterium]